MKSEAKLQTVYQLHYLPHIFLSKHNLFPVIDHKAGDAHYLIPVFESRKMIQIVDLRRHKRILRWAAVTSSGHMVQDRETRIFIFTVLDIFPRSSSVFSSSG